MSRSGNRIYSDEALTTNPIWSQTIGYDPYKSSKINKNNQPKKGIQNEQYMGIC